MKKQWILRLSGLSVVALAVAALGSSASAAKGGGGGGGFECPDVWMPVICSNGVVYSNGCYASKAGATGCVPWGND